MKVTRDQLKYVVDKLSSMIDDSVWMYDIDSDLFKDEPKYNEGKWMLSDGQYALSLANLYDENYNLLRTYIKLVSTNTSGLNSEDSIELYKTRKDKNADQMVFVFEEDGYKGFYEGDYYFNDSETMNKYPLLNFFEEKEKIIAYLKSLGKYESK